MKHASFSPPLHAVVIGVSGGIGAALTTHLLADSRVAKVYAASRNPLPPANEKQVSLLLDITDEVSIQTAAKHISEPLDIVIIATGILHGETFGPEKSLRDMELGNFETVFRINTHGPGLVIKHFAPKLRKDGKSVLAAISARVGSIGDNRLGGWYAYRASKAALNMVIKTASIEITRRNKHAAIIGLHPGTVDTGLSKPFQRGVPAGKLFSPDQSAGYLLDVIDKVDAADSGHMFAWDGTRVPE